MAHLFHSPTGGDPPGIRWPFRVMAAVTGLVMLVVLSIPVKKAFVAGDVRGLLMLGLGVLVLAGPYMWLAARGVPPVERYARELAAKMGQTITITASRERFTFASAGREVTIDTVLRVAPNGRILGFGASKSPGAGETIHLFGAREVDERALGVFCRRGQALALGPWSLIRPRVIVRGAGRLDVSREVLTRALRGAGAATIAFAD